MVDDEPGILQISKEFLETFHGMRVTIINDGHEALAALAAKEYDAVVSDYQMPVMDGLQLLKEVRARGHNIPFILFTGRGREEVAMEALNNGADFYVQKGGDAASQYLDLAHKVRKAAGEREKERKLRMENLRLDKLLELYRMEDRSEGSLFRYALRSALELSDASFGFLGRIDERAGTMSLICTIGAGTPMEDPSSPPKMNVANGPWTEAVRTRKAYVLNDARGRSDTELSCPNMGSMNNIMIVPLLDDDQVVLALGVGDNSNGFDDSDVMQVSLLLNGVWEIVKRRRTEESLCLSNMELVSNQDRLMDVENKFQTIFERSQDGMALMGERFREANTRWGDMLGYSHEELIGMRPWEVSPPKQPNGGDSEKLAKAHISKAMKDIMDHFEWTHITKDGRTLECDVILQKVTSKGEDLLMATIRDISREKRDAQVMEFMYRISEAVQTDKDRRELFANIYDSLASLLSVDSFYVAFREGDELEFPFYVDHGDWKDVASRKCEMGVTEHVLDAGQPILLDRSMLETLMEAGKISQVGEPSEEFMGVPLSVKGRTVGILAVQRYEAPCRFRQEDLDLLTFLSEQVSLALERMEIRKESMAAHSLLKGTVDSIPIGILVTDERNRVLMANRPLRERIGSLEGHDIIDQLDVLTRFAADDEWRSFLDIDLKADPGTITKTIGSKDGRSFEVIRSPYMVEGRIAGSILTINDVTEVREIAKGLQESEASLRAILTAAPVGMCVLKDRRFQRTNERLLEMLGYEKHELQGKTTAMLYESDHEFERIGRELTDADPGNRVRWTKTRWRRRDGSFIDLLMSVSVFTPGRPENGYVVTLTDLTEIEEARRKLQDRLEMEAVLASVSRLFSDMDIANHYQVLEKALGAIGAYEGADRAYLFEIDPVSGLGSNTVEWVAEGARGYKEEMQGLSTEDHPWWMKMLREQGTITIPDVSKMPPEASKERAIMEAQGSSSAAIAALTVDRELVGFLGFDFSKGDHRSMERDLYLLRFIGDMFSSALSRWAKEKEIRQEQEKLVNALNGAPMGAMVFEKEGGALSLTYFNEEAGVMLGEHAMDFLGRLPEETMPFLGEEAVDRLLVNATEGIWTAGGREFQDPRSGELYQIWTSMLDRDHLAVFLLNVTDLRNLDQRLILANNKLTLVTRLATHDVRNKAMAVSANLDLLSLKFKDEGVARYIENANKGLRDLQEITDRLHGYLSIGIGHLGWTDLEESVRVAMGYMDRTDQMLPAVEVGEEVKAYEVQADELLPTLLHNLLCNSIKHGGGVTSIRLGAHIREGDLWLIYEDDGVGIPEEVRDCLFDFTLNGRRQGHGLNFIKETLEMYGMRIELDRTYDKGARFLLRVPQGQFRRKAKA